jgi:broad specificity phosphatase PhoE
MKDMNIYLIRHGESTTNIIPDIIGQEPDTELTSNGVNQAGRLGKRFLNDKIELDRIWSSTYKRDMDTANIFSKVVGYKSSLGLSSDLIEYNAGSWKGKKRSEIYTDLENLQKLTYLNMGFVFPNGESYSQVERRASSFIEKNVLYADDMVKLAQTKPLHIAIFSHGQTIKSLLHYVMGFDQSFMWKISINNTAITHLIFGDRGWFLKSLNDTAHLYADEKARPPEKI